MALVLAAVGAVVAALLEPTIASRFLFADAQLQIVLVFAVVLTLVVGFEGGMAWAFVGGLVSDLLTLRPLGSTLFVLLVTVGAAAILGRVLTHYRLVGPIVGVFFLTMFYTVLSQMITHGLHYSSPALQLRTLAAEAGVNAVAAAVITPPLVALKKRTEERERVVW
ncbi:MAG: rod shape-determining protein MreD [Candidatus Limnocylindrales bacterium]